MKELEELPDRRWLAALNDKAETIKRVLGLILLVHCLVIVLLAFMIIWNIYV